MKKDNYQIIGGAIVVFLLLIWKFPTFAAILALALSVSYAIKIVQINKQRKEKPDQKISYVTNIGNKKNELMFDVRKAFAIAVIILGITASLSTKAENKAVEPANVEEKQEEVKEEPKEEDEFAITDDMSYDEKIEKILKKVGKERYKNHEIHKDDDGTIRQVTLLTYIDPEKVWDGKAAVRQESERTVNALKELKENNINFNYFALSATSTFTDQYGNDNESELMHIYIPQEEVDKINFEKFQYENLKNIADEFYVHPSVK